jgi:hypothetical protein
VKPVFGIVQPLLAVGLMQDHKNASPGGQAHEVGTFQSRYEAKVHQDFLTFRKQILQYEPDFELGQGSFEGGMAVANIAGMIKEIERRP